MFYFILDVDCCLNESMTPQTIHDLKLSTNPWHNMQQIFDAALESETLILLFSDVLDEEQCILSQQIFDKSVLRYLGIYSIINALAAMIRDKKINMYIAILICHHYALIPEMVPRVKRYLYTIVYK